MFNDSETIPNASTTIENYLDPVFCKEKGIPEYFGLLSIWGTSDRSKKLFAEIQRYASGNFSYSDLMGNEFTELKKHLQKVHLAAFDCFYECKFPQDDIRECLYAHYNKAIQSSMYFENNVSFIETVNISIRYSQVKLK